MDFTSIVKNAKNPSKLGIIGATRGYGYTLLAQMVHVPLLQLRVISSRHEDECRAVLEELGFHKEQPIIACHGIEDIQAAPENAILIVSDYRLVMECGITSLVECTGNTAVSSDAALIALNKGINVYMVSKETDSICGPMLNQVAAKNNCVYALVNGDQPRNLIDLYSWAKMCGLDVVAAGKASEYDFIYDPDTAEFSYLDYKENIPALKDCWRFTGSETLKARHALLGKHTDVISADLCEMNLVSNVTGLVPASPTMTYPICKISELADIFVPVEDGGILTRTGVVDVFFHLHAPDEASFAGGEFVIVRCENEKVWQLLTEKGHVVSRNGKYCCMYEPYHFMGVETPASIILGDQLGIGTHPECRQVSVMAGVAKWDIPAGTVLKVAGHHHSIEVLTPNLIEYTACPADVVPFYLLNNAVVTRDIKQGEKVSLSAIEVANKETFGYYQEGLKL